MRRRIIQKNEKQNTALDEKQLRWYGCRNTGEGTVELLTNGNGVTIFFCTGLAPWLRKVNHRRLFLRGKKILY
jgi:hypothetical protein